MPYRRVAIANTATGEVEEFLVRISARGIADWLGDRDSLRASGKPDRPPDVDTDTLRTWVQWPGEENLPFFRDGNEAHAGATRPADAVYSLSWHEGQRNAFLQVLAFLDDAGGYEVTYAGTPSNLPGDLVKSYPGSVPGDAVWAEVEEFVEALNVGWSRTPKVTSYLDARWFEAEIALAEAEVAHGFLSLPEGRA
jgi:hypothetical protein